MNAYFEKYKSEVNLHPGAVVLGTEIGENAPIILRLFSSYTHIWVPPGANDLLELIAFSAADHGPHHSTVFTNLKVPKKDRENIQTWHGSMFGNVTHSWEDYRLMVELVLKVREGYKLIEPHLFFVFREEPPFEKDEKKNIKPFPWPKNNCGIHYVFPTDRKPRFSSVAHIRKEDDYYVMDAKTREGVKTFHFRV